MPLMFISFGLQYMDKALLSTAAQFGIVQDLHLYDIVIVDGEPKHNLVKFSYVTMIFYWGYFAGCFPALYLSQRLPIGKYAGIAIIVWGGVTMSSAAVTTYHSFLAQRFFLGFCEAAISPAFSLITAMWYRREEQPLRLAIWYAATGFGSLVGNLSAWGIGHINGSLSPWQYQYLILGALTSVWGAIRAWLLPDNPTNARFLSEDEKVFAVQRMCDGQTGIQNRHFKAYQVADALTDPKTYFLLFMTFCIHMVNGAVSGFGSIIVTGFGFNGLYAVLLLGVVGAIVFITLILSGIWSVYIKNQRINVMVVVILPVIADCITIWKAPWKPLAAPLVGFYLLGFFAAGYVMILALMSANTAGHTKKAFTAGLMWATYCISNGVAPLLVKTTEVAEHYPALFKPLIALLVANVVAAVGLRFYLENENKKGDRHSSVSGESTAETAFKDLTDRVNPNFRYTW
ncbi:MFS general substrate transporter [Cadophora sp. DSE1049]|nr:MFS general substrate transporter [Cadophora sp. DSE1049]